MVDAGRLARVAAGILWLVAVATMLATFGVVPFPTSDQWLQALATPGFATVGLLIVWRRPLNSVGWLMLGMGSLPALGGLIGVDVLVQNGAVLACLALVLVVFPDGRVPSRVWWVAVSLLGLGWVIAAAAPDFTWTRSHEFAVPIGVAMAMIGVLWCGAAPFVRRRRAGATERLQLRWMGAATSLSATLGGVALVGIALGAPQVMVDAVGLLTVLCGAIGIPTSILVAVLRYRLYEIDRLISRTVTYALIILLLAAVYAGTTVLLAQTVAGDSPVTVAFSTLVTFALFSPLRRVVQRRVDRRFNRTRYRAQEELDAFVRRLSETADEQAVRLDLKAVVERTVQPGAFGMWIRPGEARRSY